MSPREPGHRVTYDGRTEYFHTSRAAVMRAEREETPERPALVEIRSADGKWHEVQR